MRKYYCQKMDMPECRLLTGSTCLQSLNCIRLLCVMQLLDALYGTARNAPSRFCKETKKCQTFKGINIFLRTIVFILWKQSNCYVIGITHNLKLKIYSLGNFDVKTTEPA